MTHRILITALSSNNQRRGMSYYCAKDLRERTLYCDALLTAEASCKYALSAYPVDEIIVFGREETEQPDPEKALPLRQRKEALSYDIETASGFSVLLYRLTQFFDDVSIEDADRNNLLTAQEQQQTVDFLRRFFREQVNPDGEKKFSRFFHYLLQDSALRRAITDELDAWLPNPKADRERYKKWIFSFLYRELKATYKLEPLDRNENVCVRYFRLDENRLIPFLNRMIPVFRGEEVEDGVPDDTELIVTIMYDRGSDVLTILNTLNLIKILPSAQIHVSHFIMERRTDEFPIFELESKSEEYGISDFLARMSAFLSYGKTDALVEYWEGSGVSNKKIDRIIYAMRNIDYGISLCDISDLERGLKSMRSVVRNDLPIGGSTMVEEFFELAIESIRRDYGSLLEGDKIPFIDLVKWAYRKGFLQQTLTLVESRAPNDFVDKGIFFYSDGPRTRKHALEILGQTYYDMKTYERYKMGDISHYFVKYYSRRRVPHTEGASNERRYAGVRVDELDTTDESLIRAHTICPDREALQDLLFAYYHLGTVRNQINHAAEEFSGFYTVKPYTDSGDRMKTIIQTVDYFIHCYDRVVGLIGDRKPNVVKIENYEIEEYAQMLRDDFRRSRNPGT